MIFRDLIKEKLEDVSFLELKEGATIEVNGQKFTGYLPLPILNKGLVEIVKENVEDIDGKYFLEGMIYVLSLDRENDYNDIYFDFIKAYTRDIKGYIMSKALDFISDDNTIEGIIYLNCLMNLNLGDEKVLFALGNALENLDISKFDDLKKNQYILEIMNIYENILNIDENFSLAHYKLGYIYKDLGQYVKAKISFKRFLELDRNDFRLQEVREQLEEIDPMVKSEEAILEMDKGNYDIALEKLLEIKSDFRDDIYFYNLSICYFSLGEVEAAFDAIFKAIEINDMPIYENQLAIYYQNIGEENKAKDILLKGLEKFGEDYYLNFNLGTILYNEGDIKNAIKNFEISYNLSKNSEISELINDLKSTL